MKKTLIENQIEKVAKLDKSVRLAEKSKSEKPSCFPSSVTYNRTLQNTKNILQQHCHLIKIDPVL